MGGIPEEYRDKIFVREGGFLVLVVIIRVSVLGCEMENSYEISYSYLEGL